MNKNSDENPGEFPYTRGIYPKMYQERKWTMRQYSGFSTAKETNKHFRMLLQKGQTGLSVAFDLPTQMGLDSDNQLTKGEVGKVGVAIDTVEDLKILFRGIDISKISTSMTINSTAIVLLAMYVVVAEETNVDTRSIAGTIQNDILKEYIARGTYIFPPDPSLRLITDIFEYCSEHFPRFNTISVSGYHIREAGSTAIQEVGFTLANGKEYVRQAIKKGMKVDDFAQRISFFFNAHNNFLEEIAKFRAARRLWAQIIKEEFHAKKSKSMKLRFHTQTGGSTLTAQQPENNIVRVAIQALSAVLGGTQSLHTNAMDEAIALPAPKAATIALRTQQIIAEESGITDAVDPFGGSFYVENLTDQIEKEAKKLIAEVEEIGIIEAINQGFIQKQIQESAYSFQLELDKKKKIVVGVNKFIQKQEDSYSPMVIEEIVREEQIIQLNAVKKLRSEDAVQKVLHTLKAVALTEENIFPYILQAVRLRSTIGEICNVLKQVWKKFEPPIVI